MSVGEKICFEIVKHGYINGKDTKVDASKIFYHTGIHFGFSAVDPGELAGHLPKDSKRKPGFFTKLLDWQLCKEGSVIDYHLTSSGEVMYRVNGEEKGVLFSVGNKQTPLWGMMFPWGYKTIKLIHSS